MKANQKHPISQSAWSGYHKHKAEESVRAVWTVDCRRMSQDFSLSPVHGFCQQETVPTLLHIFGLQAAAQLPASSTKAGWRRAMEGGNKAPTRISFSQDKQHQSTEVSILWRSFVMGGWNMTEMNNKGARRQNCTMLLLHLPKTLVLLCPAAALIYNHLKKMILYVLYSSKKKSSKASNLCFFPFELGPTGTLALTPRITPAKNQLGSLLFASQTYSTSAATMINHQNKHMSCLSGTLCS